MGKFINAIKNVLTRPVEVVIDEVLEPIGDFLTNGKKFAAFNACKNDGVLTNAECRKQYLWGQDASDPNPAAIYSGTLSDAAGTEIYSWKDGILYEKGVAVGDYVVDNSHEVLLMAIEFIPVFGAPAGFVANIVLEEIFDESATRAEFLGVVVKYALVCAVGSIPFIGAPLAFGAEIFWDKVWARIGRKLNLFIEESEGPLPGFFYDACNFFKCNDYDVDQYGEQIDNVAAAKAAKWYESAYTSMRNATYSPDNRFCKLYQKNSYFDHRIYLAPEGYVKYSKSGKTAKCCYPADIYDGQKCVPKDTVLKKRNAAQIADYKRKHQKWICDQETDPNSKKLCMINYFPNDYLPEEEEEEVGGNTVIPSLEEGGNTVIPSLQEENKEIDYYRNIFGTGTGGTTGGNAVIPSLQNDNAKIDYYRNIFQ